MDRVVSLLSDIETNANVILSRANEQKVALYQKLDDDIKKLDIQLDESSSQKLKELQHKYDLELDKEKELLKKECDSKIKSMEDNFNNNHDILVNQIFNNVISV